MNVSTLSTDVRHRQLKSGLVLAGLFAAFLAVPAARADVRVGVSLGFELPHGYAEVRVGHDSYYHSRGVFYRRGPRGYYVVPAPRGAFIRVLPPYCTRIYVGPSLYYRYGDVYYQPMRDGYVVVERPVVETQSLPPVKPAEEYQSVWVEKNEYLFKNGQFFTKTPDGMVWVPAPVGAITRDLPTDAQSVWYQGVEYYDSDDVYFRKTPDGYQVVSQPWKK